MYSLLSTGRLKLRLIYISNYESEWGKISAQPHTFIMYEAISYFFRQTVYMNTVESTQNECTGLYGNLYLAVMLIVLECCQTHDMSLYIEGQTDCWECWWMNSRNNHFTHPPLPSWNWEMLRTIHISYDITQKVIWSLLEFFLSVETLNMSWFQTLNQQTTDFKMTTKGNKFQEFE